MAGISRDGSVGEVIVLRAARPDNRASIPGRGKDFFLFLVHFLRDPVSLQFSRYWKFCARRLSCRNVKLKTPFYPVAYPGILFGGGGGGSTNSVEDRGHRERGSGGR